MTYMCRDRVHNRLCCFIIVPLFCFVVVVVVVVFIYLFIFLFLPCSDAVFRILHSIPWRNVTSKPSKQTLEN